MQIEILNIRKSPHGYPIGYGKVGERYGEVWLDRSVTQPGLYELRTRLSVKAGRFVVELQAGPVI